MVSQGFHGFHILRGFSSTKKPCAFDLRPARWPHGSHPSWAFRLHAPRLFPVLLFRGGGGYGLPTDMGFGQMWVRFWRVPFFELLSRSTKGELPLRGLPSWERDPCLWNSRTHVLFCRFCEVTAHAQNYHRAMDLLGSCTRTFGSLAYRSQGRSSHDS